MDRLKNPVRELNLTRTCLNDDDVRTLAQAIKVNNQLCKIRLDNNLIRDELTLS